MVLLNCQLHWSVNLVVMSVFISSELGLNYILCIYYVCMYVYIIIYIYNIYIYIQSLLGCRMAPPPPMQNTGYATGCNVYDFLISYKGTVQEWGKDRGNKSLFPFQENMTTI